MFPFADFIPALDRALSAVSDLRQSLRGFADDGNPSQVDGRFDAVDLAVDTLRDFVRPRTWFDNLDDHQPFGDAGAALDAVFGDILDDADGARDAFIDSPGDFVPLAFCNRTDRRLQAMRIMADLARA